MDLCAIADQTAAHDLADNAGMPHRISKPGALERVLHDPATTRMLAVLLTGQARTAAELARSGRLEPPVATGRLTGLEACGMLRARRSGGRFYYSLADHAAAALRANGVVPHRDTVSARWQRPGWQALRHARRCHGHLAGELGVALLQALLERGLLQPREDGLVLTASGASWLPHWGVRTPPAPGGAAPRCLDWSQRQDHLGGALGRALLDALCARGWVQDGPLARSLELTPPGRRELLPWLQG